jgi:hypothetical protein
MRSAHEGYLLLGSDIGGYRGGVKEKELFIRWAQFGAFCPIMENGGAGEHRPWMFDQQTLKIYRFYVLIHKALFHYLYSEAIEAWRDGRSLITPIPEGRDQYLLGRDILVAPITARGGNSKLVLPSGSNWWPLFPDYVLKDAESCRLKNSTLPILAGGCAFNHTYDLYEYPVFIRAGSLIPLSSEPASELFLNRPEVDPKEGMLMLIPFSPSGRDNMRRVVYFEDQPPTIYSGEISVTAFGVEHSISSTEGRWPIFVPEAAFPNIPDNVEGIPFLSDLLEK